MAASVTLVFGGKEIETWVLDKPAVVVGRDDTCDVAIDNLGISRAHCQFLRRGTAWLLQDMNSSNGTFVNGRKVGEHYLNDKDTVTLGKYSLVFQTDTSPSAAAKPASSVASPQEAKASPPGAPPPDSLHTYVMDGAQIRERLAGMQAGPKAQPAQPAEMDPLRPRGAAPKKPAAPESGGMKGWLFFLIAANVLLVLVLVALLIVFLLGREGG